MDFSESEETRALRDMLRRFLDKEVPPELAARWDKEDHVPPEMVKKLGELGLCALTVPEEYGGLGRDVLGMVTVIQELARRSYGLTSLYIMNACYGGLNITESGTDEQKERLLPGLCAGETLFAYGLSEPDVGADLASVKTRAARQGDKVVINGYKRWCTGAGFADYIYLLACTGDPSERHHNLSFLLVPTDTPGITIQAIETMGAHGVPTNDVILEEVEIPAENIIGGDAGWNRGWSMLAGPALEVEKLEIPALALGIAEAAVAEAWQYSQERKQFGKAICTLQSIRHTLADLQTGLAACRLMLHQAAWKVQHQLDSAVDTSMAKLFICDTARDIVLECQKILGAYGYAEGFAMERYVRDILVMPIWGGSSAIQKNNITNLMGLPRN